jgi:signal transduction histidine kinase/DNA-binding response OmpR family regulator
MSSISCVVRQARASREGFAVLAAGGADVVVLTQSSRLAAIRSRYPGVPVVLVTTTGSPHEEPSALARGAAAVIPASRLAPADLALAVQMARVGGAREAELVRARDLAQEAARVKAEFLASMSHEIRTPIHAIIGNIELLRDTRLDPEQKEYAGTVQASAEALLGLVNDILDISRIEAGKVQPETIDFYLPAVIETAADMNALEAHRKGLELATLLPVHTPTLVRGDPVRVRQVLVNLLSNAVKFTHAGEVVASVAVRGGDEKSALLEFSVRDTGIGIAADKVGGLFQSFTQLDSSSTRKYGGSGLGLAISRGLVELMGGTIGVESTEGRGSRFWFTLPVQKQKVSDQYTAIPADFFGGMRVLVVDDNATARSILSDYLGSWGCVVEDAAGGEEALAALRRRAGTSEPFRLALIDLRMPGMDGWHLASEINADRSINATRLVLLSPAGRSADEAKMKLLGWFNAYLAKPVRKSLLLETVFSVTSGALDLEQVAPAAGAEEAAEAAEELPGAADDRRSAGLARVLVADDNEASRELFRVVLEKMGFTVVTVEDGRQAVERARAGGLDIAFLDVNMPEMGGPEAAQAMRRDGVQVPLIAVTASVRREEQERCLASGMNAFLPKPFRRQELEQVLRQWLPSASPAPSQQSLTRPAGAGKAAVLDFPAAVEAFMGREDVVRGLIRGFLERLAGRTAPMRIAFERGDMEAIRFEAHAVKGGALNLRAERLAAAALALERAAEDRHRAEIPGLLDAFESEAADLSAFVARGLVLPPGQLDDVIPEAGGDDVAQ